MAKICLCMVGVDVHDYVVYVEPVDLYFIRYKGCEFSRIAQNQHMLTLFPCKGGNLAF